MCSMNMDPKSQRYRHPQYLGNRPHGISTPLVWLDDSCAPAGSHRTRHETRVQRSVGGGDAWPPGTADGRLVGCGESGTLSAFGGGGVVCTGAGLMCGS